jgi:plastocyanin
VLCAVLAASVCASVAGATELSVRVSDGSGAALKDAVVLLTPVGEVPPAPAPAPAPQRAVIDQIDKRFVPRVTVLRTGTAVSFPNHDNIRHSIYSYSTPKRFELKLYAGTPASPVVFDKPGVVALGCNIHDSMIAWVLVVDTPWFVASDGAGAAQLTNLPPGRYRLRAWHEPMAELGEAQELVVGDAPVRMAVTLDPDRTL